MNLDTKYTEAQPPVMSGRHVVLRPLVQSDYPRLFEIEHDPALIAFYRLRGRSVPFERYGESLWAQVVTQLVITEVSSGKLQGVVALFAADFKNRYAHIAGTLSHDARGQLAALEGFGMFLDYCFKLFDLRKVYADVLEFNFRRFQSVLQGVGTEEGRLRDHEYYDGQYWDSITLAIYREEWLQRPAPGDRGRQFMQTDDGVS